MTFYVGMAVGVMIGVGLTGLCYSVFRPIPPRGCGRCWGKKIGKDGARPCQNCGRTS